MIIPKHYARSLNTIRSVAMLNGLPTFIVGGFVRDLLLGKTPNDIDIVVDASKSGARKLATLVAKETGVKPIHFSNNTTSRLFLNDTQIDFSTPYMLDDEGSRVLSSISDDVRNRDFTIDTLLINMKDYSLLDMTGRGLEDLERKVLRATDPDSFVKKIYDDPLTMLRAVRLASTLGLSIDQEVADIIHRNAVKITPKELGGQVSYSRIAKELHKILRKGDVRSAYQQLVRTDLISHLPDTKLITTIEDKSRMAQTQINKIAMSKFANKYLAVSEALVQLQHHLKGKVEAYVAGGFIRDSLMGLYPKDADLTISSPHYVCKKGGEKIMSSDLDALLEASLITEDDVTDYDGSIYKQYACAEHGEELVNGGEYAAQLIAEALNGQLSITRSKGTAIVSGIATPHGRVAIDFVSARKESYGESHKPKVQPGTLEEDVMRRDFTVNTLLIDLQDFEMGLDKFELEDRVIDITGRGLKDLENNVLQTPLDSVTTFKDDPTRIVRAIRFSAQKGFKLSSDLISAIRHGEADGMRVRDMIIEGSKAPKGSQIGDELKLAILSNPTKTMDLLVKTRLSETLDMGLHDLNISQRDSRGIHDLTVYGHTRQVVEMMQKIILEREAEGVTYSPDEKVGLYLSAMMHDVGKAKTKSIVCATKGCSFNIPYDELERLQSIENYDVSTFECPSCGNTDAKVQFIGHEDISGEFVNNMRGVFSNDILDVVEGTVLNHMKRYDPKDSPNTIRSRQREFGRNQEWILMLQQADHSSKTEELAKSWKGQVDEYRYKLSIKTPLTGNDIMNALGVAPGPDVGLIIEQLNMLALRYPQYGIPDSPDKLTQEQLTNLLDEANVSSWEQLVATRRAAVLEWLKDKSYRPKDGIVDKLPRFNGKDLMQLYSKPGGPWIRELQKKLLSNGYDDSSDRDSAMNFLRSLEVEYGPLAEDIDARSE